MDHENGAITRRKPLDLERPGFPKYDHKQPWGVRTPNGQIWAHDLDDLYDVRPSEDWYSPVYWSVSMVREFELASRVILDASETNLQKTHCPSWKIYPKNPWPLLRFPDKVRRQKDLGISDEQVDYCRNLHRTPWRLKRFNSDEDYYVIDMNEKVTHAPCFCDHCEDPELRLPTSSLYCAKHHFGVHCRCQKRKLRKRSRSLPDISDVVNHRKTDHSSTSKIAQFQQRQSSMESVDIEKIPFSAETMARIKLPPKLEEFIPNDFLPDLLLVNDDDDCATGQQGLRQKFESAQKRIRNGKSQRRYRRLLPAISNQGTFTFSSIYHILWNASRKNMELSFRQYHSLLLVNCYLPKRIHRLCHYEQSCNDN